LILNHLSRGDRITLVKQFATTATNWIALLARRILQPLQKAAGVLAIPELKQVLFFLAFTEFQRILPAPITSYTKEVGQIIVS